MQLPNPRITLRSMRALSLPLVPAKAGTQRRRYHIRYGLLDSRFRGNERSVKIAFAESEKRDPTMAFYVYMLASKRNGTLYIGMTDDLVRRIWLHRDGALHGFSRQYNVTMLVWYEQHASRESAFQRERQMKKWKRTWKLREIEAMNPNWRDLYNDIAI